MRLIAFAFFILSQFALGKCGAKFESLSIHRPKAPLFVLSGPSGAGKTTVLREAMKQSSIPVRAAVSVTTRAPRPGEQDGKDYHFWTKEKFQDALKNGQFLESAEVHGNFYGTLKSEVDTFRTQGVGVFLVIDVKGMENIKKLYPDLVPFFLTTSTPQIFEERLRKRGTETEEAIQRRLKNAEEELSRSGEYRYQLINDDLQKAVLDLTKIVNSESSGFAKSN